MFWQLAFCNTDRIALCHFFIHLKYVKDFILKKKKKKKKSNFSALTERKIRKCLQWEVYLSPFPK